MAVSKLESLLEQHLTLANIPFITEHRFAAEIVGGTGKGLRARLQANNLKDWRFDFVIDIAGIKLAVECEGGGWTGGRHGRGAGFASDLRKYSAAMANGWTVYRCDLAMIQEGQALQVIELLIELLKKREDV